MGGDRLYREVACLSSTCGIPRADDLGRGIFRILCASLGDILDDVDLILSLEEAKKTSDEVKEKVVVAQETEARINETSENYRPSANRGALLFFLLMDLCKVHSFYKCYFTPVEWKGWRPLPDRYSLDAFVQVVTRAVDSVSLRKPKVEPVAAKVEEVKEREAAGGAQEGNERLVIGIVVMEDADSSDGEEGDEVAAVVEEEVVEEEEEEEVNDVVEVMGRLCTLWTLSRLSSS